MIKYADGILLKSIFPRCQQGAVHKGLIKTAPLQQISRILFLHFGIVDIFLIIHGNHIQPHRALATVLSAVPFLPVSAPLSEFPFPE